MARIEMIGKVFSRLTVLQSDGYIRPRKPAYLCQCECGNTARVDGGFLRSGKTKSCGCLRQETAARSVRAMNTTHGKFGTRVYQIWTMLLQRILNPRSKEYRWYGGRGITLDERWKKFENFYADMGDPPSDAHTLDRRDNDGGYFRENCRWATSEEQANNRSNNVLITWKGDTRTLAQWAKLRGLNQCTLRRRLKSGWPVEQALLTPVLRRQGVDSDG